MGPSRLCDPVRTGAAVRQRLRVLKDEPPFRGLGLNCLGSPTYGQLFSSKLSSISFQLEESRSNRVSSAARATASLRVRCAVTCSDGPSELVNELLEKIRLEGRYTVVCGDTEGNIIVRGFRVGSGFGGHTVASISRAWVSS